MPYVSHQHNVHVVVLKTRDIARLIAMNSILATKNIKSYAMRLCYVATTIHGSQILQEWLAAPTAVEYADGQMSGPSAYVRSMAAAHLAPRRRHTLGVETDTPTATLGVLKAVGVALACAPVPLRP
jgi:hypothetical protein